MSLVAAQDGSTILRLWSLYKIAYYIKLLSIENFAAQDCTNCVRDGGSPAVVAAHNWGTCYTEIVVSVYNCLLYKIAYYAQLCKRWFWIGARLQYYTASTI